ncbi:glycoside hydrolase family 127 protein [Ktedonospora formicarum]|uniref:Glycoside hydrolase family 127 protein n=1 Tax=Ktedonospora formicarum TaxID=2778364 RepID=A0A8J3I9E8_9CHLR|nr:beta-L-arabinofuranosidase domain-containing protein [Ktedonospora formicarum]GHO47899.1 hypothetical protein KSX_60620 [Ktedonospora formicarum]
MTLQHTRTHEPFIVDTTSSKLASLRPLHLRQVRLQDAFWEPRRQVNREITLPSQYQQCVTTGRLDNFKRAAGQIQGPFQGMFYNDSDVYKWVEAVAWTLAAEKDERLEAEVDEVIGLIAAAQGEDGYLNTYFTFENADQRWSNLRDMHELYCAGHLFQAAVAHHRATGKTTLLDVATRFADYIDSVFGTGERAGTCGHPEIEMALVELSRETGEERYLALAQRFIDNRGLEPPVVGGSTYHQDHAPFRQQNEVVGHAVRALYLYSGATDAYTQTGEQALLDAVNSLWSDLQEHKVYITGGVGSRYEGEAFGEPYELPNDRAYTETCASIAHIMWAWRLLLLTGESTYADALELALYNGMLSGISQDGESYFYQNPLADRGKHRRQPWFGTACCPPNIARLLASLPGYLYTTSENTLWAHLYASSEANVHLPQGGALTVRQSSNYPWDGKIEFSIEPETGQTTFELNLRIPAWAEGATVNVNGEALTAPVRPGSYYHIERDWRAGDRVELVLPLAMRAVTSHPHVSNNNGRVALLRGPLLYCVEQADHQADVWDITLPRQFEWSEHFDANLLGGVVTAQTQALAHTDQGWQGQLYRPYGQEQPTYTPTQLTAIPYYAWANREPGPMQVWLPIKPE